MSKRSTDSIEMYFGVLADPLVKQLRGFHVPKGDVAHWQKDADAIARLSIRRVLPESVVREARQKLLNQITTFIRKAQQ